MKKILRKVFQFIGKLNYRYEYRNYYAKTGTYIRDHFRKTSSRKKLSAQQADEVKRFYKGLTGKDVSLLYHEYFYSRTGIYTKDYMPIDLYEADIIGRANRLDMRDAYCDKNMTELILPHIRQPHSFLKNVNGYYYFEGTPVSLEEAVEKCADLHECLIKPSLLSKGKGVQKMMLENGVDTVSGQAVREVLSTYGKNFILQEVVHQHPKMSALNPTSINTIRIMTYRSGMEVMVVYAAVRIGRKGAVIDNQSAGGISAKVNEDGTIAKYAFGAPGNDMIEKTDTGIMLEGYEIPSFEKVIETVKRSHYDLPFFDIVGWDMSVADDGEPVLIEWNAKVGPSQTACGTGLGKYTERIIKEVWPRRNTRVFVKQYQGDR